MSRTALYIYDLTRYIYMTYQGGVEARRTAANRLGAAGTPLLYLLDLGTHIHYLQGREGNHFLHLTLLAPADDDYYYYLPPRVRSRDG